MKQMKYAMERAQLLEHELANERIQIDKGPVKAVFNGVGENQKIKIDPSVVDPEDIEALEDLIVSAVKDGFTQTTELRNQWVSQITPNIPGF